MAANALSAPPKCRHFPWQGSQHQTWLKRSRSRLQSLGAHSLGTESHRIEQVNIRGVLRPPQQNEYWRILHLVCQESPERPIMFLAYLHMRLCVDSALLLSAIGNTFYGLHIFPWTTNDDASPSAVHGLFWIRLCPRLLLSQPAFLRDLRIF